MVSKNGMEVNEGNLTLRSELRTSPVSRSPLYIVSHSSLSSCLTKALRLPYNRVRI